jgi:hypothetical protein
LDAAQTPSYTTPIHFWRHIMKLNLNSVRDNVINATVSVLNKAKAKPPTAGQTLKVIMDNNDLTNAEKADLCVNLAKELSDNA